MQTIKVPKEVMEVFYEAAACEQLAKNSGFLKALYYKSKAVKAQAIAMRAMQAAHAVTAKGEWHINLTLGTMNKADDPLVVKPKKSRAKKVAVAAAVVAPTTKGETA